MRLASAPDGVYAHRIALRAPCQLTTKILSYLDGVFQLRNPFSENPFGKNCVLALLPSDTFSLGKPASAHASN
jgi:hypothetical protein